VGIYETHEQSSTSQYPGSRQSAVTWIDGEDNLWLFGGLGYASNSTGGHLNDLWKYNTSSKTWTWMSGDQEVNVPSSFGPLGSPSPSSMPGGRGVSVSWISSDTSEYLWLFGGENETIAFNDLWQFNISSKEWTWVGGTDLFQSAGVYGQIGVPSPSNFPGARYYSVSFDTRKADQLLWLFGGRGVDSNGVFGSLNDFWNFNIQQKEWTWAGGSNITNQQGFRGDKGVASTNYVPGLRFGAISWTTNNGSILWLFGGYSIDVNNNVGTCKSHF
jgi:hypothetical protein